MDYALGIDVGGTKIAAALVARDGTIARRSFRLTPQTGNGRDALDTIVAAAREALAGTDPQQVAGVGVALPTFIDFPTQEIVRCVNIPLADLDVHTHLHRALRLPVTLDNDATLAAMGEATYGAAQHAQNFVLLTLGTGVGGGIYTDGKPYRGASGMAAEVGHMLINTAADAPRCPCGSRGHLEAYLGREALAARARHLAATPAGAGLFAAVEGDLAALSAETLVQLSKTGDAGALHLLREAGTLLGHALTSLVNLFNPELILIGGGLGEQVPLLLEVARQTLLDDAPPAVNSVCVKPAALGNEAGLLGAATLAFIHS